MNELQSGIRRARARRRGAHPNAGRLPLSHLPRRRNRTRTPEARREEAVGLAQAIDLDVVGSELVAARRASGPRPTSAKARSAELAARVAAEEASLVVMDCALSPVQQRNLEKEFKAKVIDRTGLILEIFGRRARTAEGSLQVELAHLAYQKSRLVRSWTHLERQRGGFGFLGGPGETQIETDRRLIQERMIRLERDLEQVKKTRGAASRQPARRSLSDRRAGRLHQRGQVDAVQSADPRRRGRGRHAVRDARSDHAARSSCRMAARRSSPTRSGSSPICRPC